MAWRGDGKVVACGQEDGSLLLYGVHSAADPLHGCALACGGAQAPVAFLRWFTVQGRDYKLLEDLGSLLPPLKPLPKSDLPRASHECEPCDLWSLFPHSNSSQHYIPHLLLAANEMGQITIFAQGTLPVCTIDVSQALNNVRVRVLNVSASSTLVSVVAARADDTGAIFHISYDVSQVFTAEVAQVCLLARYTTSLQHVIAYLDRAVSIASEKWTEGCGKLRAKLEGLEQLLRDQGCESSAECALMDLLATGQMSMGMEQFVGGLDSPQQKQVFKSAETAVVATQQLLIEHIQPAIDWVNILLEELSGLASWDKFSRLGKFEAALCGALRLCGDVAESVAQLSRELPRVGDNFRGVLAWLLQVKVLIDAAQQPPQPDGSRPRLTGVPSGIDVDLAQTVLQFIECGARAPAVEALLGTAAIEECPLRRLTTALHDESALLAAAATSQCASMISAAFVQPMPIATSDLPCARATSYHTSDAGLRITLLIGTGHAECALLVMCAQVGAAKAAAAAAHPQPPPASIAELASRADEPTPPAPPVPPVSLSLRLVPLGSAPVADVCFFTEKEVAVLHCVDAPESRLTLSLFNLDDALAVSTEELKAALAAPMLPVTSTSQADAAALCGTAEAGGCRLAVGEQRALGAAWTKGKLCIYDMRAPCNNEDATDESQQQGAGAS
eukprot:TRINITY_DN3898_c0_g1_i1.p1 TRINITY_DN3898_c0_g1~~TRINITY_DN3898_c0_g1_i1.p1  ORF type:complete len:772 (+),score=192.28 TRINITY_DN3898_c0_g1_i1:295-2316(+)